MRTVTAACSVVPRQEKVRSPCADVRDTSAAPASGMAITLSSPRSPTSTATPTHRLMTGLLPEPPHSPPGQRAARRCETARTAGADRFVCCVAALYHFSPETLAHLAWEKGPAPASGPRVQ